MRDSMHILDQLRQRGYEPQDDARPGEGWFDRYYDGSTLRVIVTKDEVRFCAFDTYMALEWDARFPDGCPSPVLFAALDAAEREASGEPRRHVGMEAHDGYAPHSHEVRPDHLGITRLVK